MLRKVGVLLAALVATMAVVASAANANEYLEDPLAEPQTTNIPYTAWVGTQIRLAKCFDLQRSDIPASVDVEALDGGQRISLDSLVYRGKYTIEAWSGANNSIVNSPFFVNGANGDRTSQDVVPFVERYRGPAVGIYDPATKEYPRYWAGDEGYRVCFAVHLTSYSPGLAVVKLAIREDLLGLFPGMEPELKHQFLAIFMTATAPTLTEEPGGGDPTGDGNYHPQGTAPNRHWNPGFVKVSVKGTFPHGSLGPVFPTGPANVTLPDDWATLANLWAVDTNPLAGGVYGSAPNRWDIHDDTLETEGHNSSLCVNLPAANEAVDNCIGNIGNYDGELGPFSRSAVDHDFLGEEAAFPAIGPFDPLRPNSSFIPDGKVDAGDSNMPALRVDLDTTGTIGILTKADKGEIYSRDGSGADDAHNLYAPFYKAYIPAANKGGTSGVAGALGNNFPGFVTDGTYDYWDTLLLERYTNPANTCRNPLGHVYNTSGGVGGVTIYTDEHGEGWVMYDPNVDPVRGGFPLTPTVADTTNRKCDLSPGVAGVEQITARGFYPEQPALAIAFPQTLTKTVHHEASKTLTCAPKTGFEGIICTETITDLAGNPLGGAKVRLSVVSEVGGGAQVLQGEGQVGVLDQKGLTLTTDAAGQAKAYISDSFNRCLDIRAENLGTQWLPARADGPGNDSSVGITRTVKYTGITGVVCGTGNGGGSGGGDGGGSGGGNGGGNGGSSGGSSGGSGVVVSLGGPVIQAQPVLPVATTKTALVASTSAKLFSVKVMQNKLGRYLVVNVKGTSSKKAKVLYLVKNKKSGKLVKQWRLMPIAKVKFQILGQNGNVIRTVTRTVPINKAYTIANLKLPKAAASVRASVLSA